MSSISLQGWDVYISRPAYINSVTTKRIAKELETKYKFKAHYCKNLDTYTSCEKEIGDVDLVIAYLPSDNILGKGSYSEIQYALSEDIPVVMMQTDLKTFHYVNNLNEYEVLNSGTDWAKFVRFKERHYTPHKERVFEYLKQLKPKAFYNIGEKGVYEDNKEKTVQEKFVEFKREENSSSNCFDHQSVQNNQNYYYLT